MVNDLIEYAFSVKPKDVCIEIKDYIQTALPVHLVSTSKIIFLHCGLFSEYTLLRFFPRIFSRIEINRPHPNLQERFFSIEDDFLISNIIGNTRLIHNLVLLRLAGIPKDRIRVIPGQIDFSEEYTYAIKGMIEEDIVEKVVFSFNSRQILDVMIDEFHIKPEISFWTGSLLKAIWINPKKTLLIHLTSVYGNQIVALLEVLIQKFSLKKVLIFGACGALRNTIGLHDTVVIRNIMDNFGNTILSGNLLKSIVTDFPAGLTGFNHSCFDDTTSVRCIPAESTIELERLLQYGIGITDLELLPMANLLAQNLSVSWGAALHVSDRPLYGKEQLGTIPVLKNRDQARRNEILNQAKIIINI